MLVCLNVSDQRVWDIMNQNSIWKSKTIQEIVHRERERGGGGGGGDLNVWEH